MLTLLQKLKIGVKSGEITSPFTTNDLKHWIRACGIINDETNSDYAKSYIEGFLSSSTLTSTSTKKDKELIKFGSEPESYSFQDDK
ncbi:hypothetical protein [Clostridium algidicarnis]|uniref:hypothetical protein n=1 Tax=Clostridium algidicarnis TaxID=37659 RepID=UPI001C0AA59A|nr:hypothetical protein [Clostridium algidicarnis]MBU3202954.1 hypothetical protein [Clostridium algidicarnis]MBU3211108.1 hypothetical protein [Clostridium algidicarnis]MBU3222384.1 hypothetical protein [Clostridium algidicarnis]